MTPTTYDELLARVLTLIAHSEKPPVVAIAGCGGAGKSTLALRLAKDVGVHEDQVVGTDGLYARTDTDRAARWELHDWPALFELLEAVRAEPTPERLRYRYRWFYGQEGDSDAELELWDTKWVPESVEYQRLVRPQELAHMVISVSG